jgi:hypothetical protein
LSFKGQFFAHFKGENHNMLTMLYLSNTKRDSHMEINTLFDQLHSLLSIPKVA